MLVAGSHSVILFVIVVINIPTPTATTRENFSSSQMRENFRSDC